MNEFIKKITENKSKIPLLVLIVGVAIVLLSSMPKNKESSETTLIYDQDDYLAKLEDRVEAIVSSIKGAGECEVMINLSSSSESVYVKENKSSYDSGGENSKSESEDSVITMKDGDGNEYALITKQIMPQVCGVIVSCEGGSDIYVKQAVTEAVCTVLGIGANNVCVIAKS